MEKRMDNCPLVEVCVDYRTLAEALGTWYGTPEEKAAKMGEYTVYMLGCLCDELVAFRRGRKDDLV